MEEQESSSFINQKQILIRNNQEENWRTTTIKELISKKNELVFKFTETTIKECTQIMKEKNILSVPVFDKERNLFIGIVDMFEIMRYTTLGFFEKRIMKDNLFESQEFKTKTIGELVKMSPRCQHIYVLKSSDTLGIAINAIGRHHRMLVKMMEDNDDQEKITPSPLFRLLSQTDIIHYWANNPKKLEKYQKKLLNTPIIQIQSIYKSNKTSRLVTLNSGEKTINGFYKMFHENVNAVGIIDDNGKLVGNLSASDLRGLTSDSVNFLKLPPLTFLYLMTGKTQILPITCTQQSTLQEIINSIIQYKIHRVWIINHLNKPIGLITLTDLIRILSQNLILPQE